MNEVAATAKLKAAIQVFLSIIFPSIISIDQLSTPRMVPINGKLGRHFLGAR
ncbi:hypothetical protein CES85_4500 [Ochrobactrum quorumnocens]|uniref:Uncharacterized protein n=1 Tax=Ochrobactrum quorumnocens TaxID=271865 RepID=A0A248UA96_9HYPH|nr:hypothetical protein CES85_4500 [[Ochrobactrum] quorumnocens]